MFQGIKLERFGALTEWESRLLENVKKGFHDSDQLYGGGRPEDALAPMCNAIDAAKTLRLSLLGGDASVENNRRKFIEFIDLQVPTKDDGGPEFALVDARRGELAKYSFSSLVYAIRCMAHENENLNAAEWSGYHILLDWRRLPLGPGGPVMAVLQDGRLTVDGHFLWRRLRELLAGFITWLDSMIGRARGESRFNITSTPTLGSLRATKSLSRDA